MILESCSDETNTFVRLIETFLGHEVGVVLTDETKKRGILNEVNFEEIVVSGEHIPMDRVDVVYPINQHLFNSILETENSNISN